MSRSTSFIDAMEVVDLEVRAPVVIRAEPDLSTSHFFEGMSGHVYFCGFKPVSGDDNSKVVVKLTLAVTSRTRR